MKFIGVPTATQGQLYNVEDGSPINAGTTLSNNCFLGVCSGFAVQYVPFANFNTLGAPPVSFTWYFNDASTALDETGVPVQTAYVTVNAVNDAPVITDTFVGTRTIVMGYFNNPLCTTTCETPDPLTVIDMTFNDDASAASLLTVTYTATFCRSLTLAAATQAHFGPGQFVQNSNASFTVIGNLVTLQSLFSVDGILFFAQDKTTVPVLHADTNAAITINVNDGGATGSGGPLSTIKVIPVLLKAPVAGGGGGGRGAGGLIGVSSLMSLLIFGVYRFLAKKKIIPEEVDPWENDDMFDATVDNPLRMTSLE